MRKTALVLGTIASCLLAAGSASAGPGGDATSAITTVLDKFNGGDIQAFFTAHRDGAVIIDEFAPYVWGGSGSAQRWGEDYGKDAAARGISGGRVDYGKPIQASSDGANAYIVLPTTYRFTQKGTKMAGAGSMTFVMGRAGGEWKISSWTYAGATPTPEK
jgi:ketosteroid isomerase-like protein